MQDLFQYLNRITPISDETWRKIKGLFIEKELKKGDFFAETGIVSTQIGFLKKGVIRSFYSNSKGEEYNKNFFVGPSLIGAYTSLITSYPNELAQQALTDCRVLAADYQYIRTLFDTCHDLERVGRLQAETYFVEKEIREIQLVMLEAKERYEIFQKQYPTLEQLIPQYHIASFLGIKPVQLSRIRSKGIPYHRIMERRGNDA